MSNPIQTSKSSTFGIFDFASVDQAQARSLALNFNDINDTQHQGVLGQKIVISIQRGKNMQTKIEGIPSHFSLNKLLKKLKAKDMLACGGHIAKDKETGCEFIVLQGRFTAEVTAFLTSEGLVDADCIVCRGE
jgi:translation initiation factor 1 (eIF-1/SUI1)